MKFRNLFQCSCHRKERQSPLCFSPPSFAAGSHQGDYWRAMRLAVIRCHRHKNHRFLWLLVGICAHWVLFGHNLNWKAMSIPMQKQLVPAHERMKQVVAIQSLVLDPHWERSPNECCMQHNRGGSCLGSLSCWRIPLWIHLRVSYDVVGCLLLHCRQKDQSCHHHRPSMCLVLRNFDRRPACPPLPPHHHHRHHPH